MNVLIIDNYDSFTFNLYQYIGEILSSAQSRAELGEFSVSVKRNDALTLAQIQQLQPDRIIISPGPGSPDDERYFGVCAEVIRTLGPTTPLLGVCLGMQGIVHSFGGQIIKAPVPMHGKVSPIQHDHCGLFAGVPDQLEVMRYHSLIANPKTLPDCLRVTSAVGAWAAADFDDRSRLQRDGDFEIMAVQHVDHPIYGIQFHPESFATEGGKDLIRNFLFQA
ncbi:aminodeoxychorismate/anthranilate synthase component II [Reinekea sp.]|jgi:anthranilate synthase component 2|uniref:anthranilate synthase component II n=1 Tax=Reinekea sp. TaxID=1970455 RepID=UPI002A82468F|nr:aminodeoxychorismate/anthranilate synthase component II [Reinekea sp.]